jgi:hypothetical protein
LYGSDHYRHDKRGGGGNFQTTRGYERKGSKQGFKGRFCLASAKTSMGMKEGSCGLFSGNMYVGVRFYLTRVAVVGG